MAAFAISRRRLLSQAGAALSAVGLHHACAAQTAPPVQRAVASPRSLADLARARGLHFGAAVRPDQLAAEPDLRACALAQCTSLTPEIHLKWDSLEPSPGEYNDAPVEALLDLAQTKGLRVRGHTLLWGRSTPPWAQRQILQTGRWDLTANHIGRTLHRYGARIGSWDVVNEPIDTQEGDGGLRRNVFLQAYGPDYIARALWEARAHAPAARLFVNDYGFDYDNPVDAARRVRLLRLLHDLRSRGAPVDGVGVQAHLDLAKGPLARRAITAFLAEIADLGLDIEITELDVQEAECHAPLSERDRKVADETKRYLEVALANPRVRAVTTWGLTDRHSWLSSGRTASSSEQNRGLPYDRAFVAKPMYDAIVSVLSQGLARSI